MIGRFELQEVLDQVRRARDAYARGDVREALGATYLAHRWQARTSLKAAYGEDLAVSRGSLKRVENLVWKWGSLLADVLTQPPSRRRAYLARLRRDERLARLNSRAS